MRNELALLILLACDQGRPAPTPKGAPLAAKPFFRLDAAPPPACKLGELCEARVVLSALGSYHINEEYPFKFVADPVHDVQVDGTGTFRRDSEKSGTMTIRFRTHRPSAQLSGTFKLSVCTSENCEIESPKIVLPVTAS